MALFNHIGARAMPYADSMRLLNALRVEETIGKLITSASSYLLVELVFTSPKEKAPTGGSDSDRGKGFL